MSVRACKLLILSLFLTGSAPAAVDPVVEYCLGAGILARLNAGGEVELGVVDGATWLPLVALQWPQPEAYRQEDLPPPFTARSREGEPGGRRGFSRDADDDGDGLIDEDPLDGRDNDGDGLIDEDYAAIGHGMGVWDLTVGERGTRLETYHWTYPNLASLVFAVFSQHGGDPAGHLRLAFHKSAAWLHADDLCATLAIDGQKPQFLAKLEDPRYVGRSLWLGAVILDLDSRQRAGTRIRAEGDILTVPVLDSYQAMALAVGPTRLRVVQDLASAIRLQAGATDPVTGRRVQWLPPAVPAELPVDQLPAVLLRQEQGHRFSLVFQVTSEQLRRWDPDQFQVAGTALGQAEQITWISAEGRQTSVAWSDSGADFAAPCLPYEMLGASGAGTLEIRYSGLTPAPTTGLEAVYADGRRAVLACETLAEPSTAATGAAATAAAAAGDLARRLQLSPALLTSFPNPFHNQTRIGFQVPATVGEAFLFEDDQDHSLDLQQRMPYADGVVSVRVTVYSLEGREVAELFTGPVGVGNHFAQWDGRDRDGRNLASGTYFCKLQIDQWSVTRRLIFIR